MAFSSKTVGFSVSHEEWEEIGMLVRLSGMNKQDSTMSRLQNKEMVIQANPMVVKALVTIVKEVGFSKEKLLRIPKHLP